MKSIKKHCLNIRCMNNSHSEWLKKSFRKLSIIFIQNLFLNVIWPESWTWKKRLCVYFSRLVRILPHDRAWSHAARMTMLGWQVARMTLKKLTSWLYFLTFITFKKNFFKYKLTLHKQSTPNDSVWSVRRRSRQFLEIHLLNPPWNLSENLKVS